MLLILISSSVPDTWYFHQKQRKIAKYVYIVDNLRIHLEFFFQFYFFLHKFFILQSPNSSGIHFSHFSFLNFLYYNPRTVRGFIFLIFPSSIFSITILQQFGDSFFSFFLLKFFILQSPNSSGIHFSHFSYQNILYYNPRTVRGFIFLILPS